MKDIINGQPFRIWKFGKNEYWVQKVTFVEQLGLLIVMAVIALFVIRGIGQPGIQITGITGLRYSEGEAWYQGVRFDKVSIRSFNGNNKSLDIRVFNSTSKRVQVWARVELGGTEQYVAILLQPGETSHCGDSFQGGTVRSIHLAEVKLDFS